MISRRTLFAALAGLVAAPSAGQASIDDEAHWRKLFGWIKRSGSIACITKDVSSWYHRPVDKTRKV